MTALRGITLTLWQRNRIVLLIVFSVVLAFSAVFAGIGPNGIEEASRNGYAQLAFALGVMLLVFGYLALIGVFIHPDADVGTGGSSFPVHMFTLPVRTSRLVLWPMLLGSTVVFALCMLLAFVARHTLATAIPQYWPPMLAAALLAALQAVFWYPLGVPYSKLVLTFLTIPGLSMCVGYAIAYEVPETYICAGLGMVILVSGFVACSGVSRARRGNVRILDLDGTDGSATRRMPNVRPFSSAAKAQSWYEWRLHGIVLPVLTAFLFAIFCIPLAWNDTYSPLTMLGGKVMLATVPTYVESYAPVLLILVPLTAWAIGCGAKRSDVKRSDRTFHLFFATRPVSDGALVAQKLWTAARSSVAAWLVLLLGIGLLLTRMQGGYQSKAGDFVAPQRLPILAVLTPYLSLDVMLHIGAILLLLAAVTWRNYAIGFWTELSGKLWLRYAYPFASLTAITAGFTVLTWISTQGRWITFSVIAQFVWAMVLLKLTLAAILIVAQYRSGSLSIATIARSAAMYAVACGSIAAIALWLTEAFRRAVVEAAVASPAVANGGIVALVILWTPLVRILAAPMMLSMNRHRIS